MKKYLDFTEETNTNKALKTKIVSVNSISSGLNLGWIMWYVPWRQYTFRPNRMIETIFNHACLSEIAKKCDEMTFERRSEARAERSGK